MCTARCRGSGTAARRRASPAPCLRSRRRSRASRLRRTRLLPRDAPRRCRTSRRGSPPSPSPRGAGAESDTDASMLPSYVIDRLSTMPLREEVMPPSRDKDSKLSILSYGNLPFRNTTHRCTILIVFRASI